MKKVLVTVVLALGTAAMAQTATQAPAAGAAQPPATGAAQQPAAGAAQPPATGQEPAQGAPPTQPQQKTIKDPAEYNAYVAAVQQQDATTRAQSLEQFLQQYSETIMKEDALIVLMATYQQTNNVPQMQSAAQRVLQANPNSVRALAVLAHLSRVQAQQAGANQQASQAALAKAREYAQAGLKALPTFHKGEGVSDQEFQQQRTQLTALFQSTLALAAFQDKNYPEAQRYYAAAVQANPNSLEDTYFLARAYLEATPPEYIQGLWMIARATGLSNNNQEIAKYGRAYYKRYHGDVDGWDQVVAQARTSPTPPAGFTIKAAPTPAEVAGETIQKYSPKELNFGDWEFILASGNQQAAGVVWQHMQSLGMMKLTGRVMTAATDRMTLAVAPDKQDTNTADVEVVFAEPVKTVPTVGATVDVAGEADTYTPEPLMITLKGGTLLAKAPAKPAAKAKAKPSARKVAPKKK